MTLEDLKLLLTFLNRAQLSGAEVPQWVQVFNALNAEINARAAPPPPPQPVPPSS